MAASDDQKSRLTLVPQASCQVQLSRLEELLDTLAPLVQREPIAVVGPQGQRYYLVDDAQFRALQGQSAPTEGAQPARASGTEAWSGPAPTFSMAADALMEDEGRRVRSGAFAEASWHIMRNRLDRHILPVLGALPLNHVDHQAIQRLMDRLLSEQASPTTQSQYLVIVRKILFWAQREKWVSAVPELPRVRVAHKPRSALTLVQYGKVLRAAKRLYRSAQESPRLKTGDGQRTRFWITPRYRQMPWEMYALIVFMVNSFIRPSDLKNLQHQHIEVVRSRHAYLRLTLPESKRHDKPIVSLQPAVRVYERLLQLRTAEGQAQAHDWVFLPQEKDREHALGVFNFWFKWVLREAKIPLQDTHGQPRTLYCLRHTAITFRLLYGEGIDMLTLARNARTSVDMIEKFYASTLTGEMNVGMLQSRRSQKKPRDWPGVQST